MPSFMSNKWFLMLLGVALGVVLQRKVNVVDKVGLGTVLTPGA